MRGQVDKALSAAPCRCSRIAVENRKNCGFPGITPDTCFSMGCCFDSKVPNVPWCFHPLPKQGNWPGSFPSSRPCRSQPEGKRQRSLARCPHLEPQVWFS